MGKENGFGWRRSCGDWATIASQRLYVEKSWFQDWGTSGHWISSRHLVYISLLIPQPHFLDF